MENLSAKEQVVKSYALPYFKQWASSFVDLKPSEVDNLDEEQAQSLLDFYSLTYWKLIFLLPLHDGAIG